MMKTVKLRRCAGTTFIVARLVWAWIATERWTVASIKNAKSPQSTLSPAKIIMVRVNPSAGTIQNVLATVPTTAPNVLVAYKAPMDRRSAADGDTNRSMAGNVAPIASVAGNTKMKGIMNATAQ